MSSIKYDDEKDIVSWTFLFGSVRSGNSVRARSYQHYDWRESEIRTRRNHVRLKLDVNLTQVPRYR